MATVARRCEGVGAGARRSQVLDISEDAPVLHLEQLVFFSRGLPVEFGNVWLKGNKYYLGTVLQRREVS
ncbi:hypothetical protein ESCOCP311B_13265 [Escherichia coli]